MSSFNKVVSVCLLSALSVSVVSVYAGGFQLWEQDAAGTGDYHAGAAVDSDNAGIEFYNPAGMVFMPKQKTYVSAGATDIPLSIKFSGTVNTSAASGNGGTTSLVPNLHVITPITKRLAAGFGVTTPFGLSSNYGQHDIALDPVGVAATKTKVLTMNFNPNVAYKILPKLAIAAGVDFLYGEADFDNQGPLSGDAYNSHLSATAWGWNVGLYFRPTQSTSLGLSYRSGITMKAAGNNTSMGDTHHVTASLPLPATLYFSAEQLFNRKFSMLLSAEYTDWSRFKSLSLSNMLNPIYPGDPGSVTVTNPYGYRDTVNVALGAHYWLTRRFMVKLGTGYDMTPTNDKYRDIRLPGTNRWAVALGVHALLGQRTLLDAGWTHFIPTHKAAIDNQGPAIDGSHQIFTKGIASIDANVFGLQLTVLF